MENQQLYNLPVPPTDVLFDSMKDILEYCQNFSKINGYAVATKNSIPDRRIYIKCSLGGKYRNRNGHSISNKRNTSTRLTDCPFLLYGFKTSEGVHKGKWKLIIKNSCHNHETTDPIAHPIHRRLTAEQEECVFRLSKAGAKPKTIMSDLLLENPGINVIAKGVSNIKSKKRLENLNGRTSIQALFDELSVEEWKMYFKVDQNNHVTHLFFSHVESVKMARQFNNVNLLDCTYKTNKFKMNLLEIIGINSCWKTFFVAFCFMSGEVEADYTWALNCLKSLYDEINVPNVFAIDRELAELNSLRIVFPDSKVLLCVWHINKNIAKNFKGTFSSEDWTIFLNKWNSIVYATSEEDYEEKWQLLKLHLGENSRIIQYLTETWMVHKRLFLSCYISDVMHLGSHTTSRVEGAHSTLKGYLENSLGDLKSVKERIYLAIKAQLQQLSAQIADEKLKVPHYLDVNMIKQGIIM